MKPLQKINLRGAEEILIDAKKHRISKGILKVDPEIIDEVIENEALLSDLPVGSIVYIDSNIFIYGASRYSKYALSC